jgi:hypothetical protein
MKLVVTRKVQLCDLLGCVAHDEDEIDRVGAGDVLLLDFLQGGGLFSVFGASLQDGLETRGVL